MRTLYVHPWLVQTPVSDSGVLDAVFGSGLIDRGRIASDPDHVLVEVPPRDKCPKLWRRNDGDTPIDRGLRAYIDVMMLTTSRKLG